MGARIYKNNQEYKQTDGDYEIFSDFDTSFLPNPFTNQLSRKTNVDSVKMSLRNLILTNKYERRRNPTYGTNVRRYLFEQIKRNTELEIEEEIRSAIENHEPRVKLLDVEVTSIEENNEIRINIEFSVVTSTSPENLQISLYRVR